MLIKALGGNIKPGAGRPTEIEVGQITILSGPHGAGKTRWDQTLQFALKGSVRDLAFRPGQEMKEGGTLLGLTQATEDSLVAWASFDDGSRVQREMPIRHDRAGVPSAGRIPDVTLPNGLQAEKVLPIAGIEATLCKRSAEVRAAYLPYILSVDSAQQSVLIADRMRTVKDDFERPEMADYTLPTTADSVSALVRSLLAAVSDLDSRVKGAKALVDRMGETLAEPQPLRVKYTQAMLGALGAFRAFQEARTAVTDTGTALGNALANIDKLQGDPGPSPAGPTAKNPFIEALPGQQALLMSLAMQQRTTCSLCESPVTVEHVSAVFARTSQASATIEQYNKSVTVPPEVTAAWNLAAARRGALQNEVERLRARTTVATEQQATAYAALEPALQALSAVLPETNPAQWGEDPSAVLAAAQGAPRDQLIEMIRRYEAVLAQESLSAQQWTQWKAARKIVEEDENRLPVLRRIILAGQAAEKALLAASLDTFRARMQRWMPLGWEAILRIEDERGSDVFRLAVRVDGINCFEPSGVQALVLLYAFALALDEARPETPCMVLTPSTECHIAKDVLPLLVDVYAQLPPHVQVFLHTVEEPSKLIAKRPGVVVHRLKGALKGTV